MALTEEQRMRLHELRQKQAAARRPSVMRGMVEDVSQLATLGFSDEIKAGLEAFITTPPGADYSKRLSQQYQDFSGQIRSGYEQYRQEYPIVSAGTQAAGAMATLPLAMRAVGQQTVQTTVPRLQRLMRGGVEGAATGAVAGAIAGAGTAEPGERLRGAATGGAIGAPAGGVAGGVVGLAMPQISRAVQPRLTSEEQLEQRANRGIQERMAQEGLTPDEAALRAQEMGPQGRIADVSPGLQQMAATAYKQPSTARGEALEFARERSEGASGRIMAVLARNLGEPRTYNAQVRELDRVMRREAGPLYEAAYQTPTRPTPYMENLLSDPNSVVSRIWQRDVVPLAREAAAAQGQQLNPMSLRTPEGLEPSTKGWDFIKRGIWQREQRAWRAGNSELARSLRQQRQQLTQDMRAQNEDYGLALDTWSGGRGVQDAMELGRGGIKKNSQDVADELADLNPREQQGYRLGYARALLGRIEGEGFTGGVAMTGDTARVFNKPDAQRSLEVVFGSRDDARTFLEDAFNESAMQRTFDMMRGGSPTFSNLAEAQSQMGQNVADAAIGYLTGTQSLPQAALGVARRGARTIPTVEPEYAGALTRQLMLERPAAFMARSNVISPTELALRPAARAAGGVAGGGSSFLLSPLLLDMLTNERR